MCHDNISSIIARFNISFSRFPNIHLDFGDSDDGGDGGDSDDGDVDNDGGGDDNDDDDDGAIGAMPIPFVLSQTFEIILTLEGITPETGNTIQVNLKRINCANFFASSETIYAINKGKDDLIDSRFRLICYNK